MRHNYTISTERNTMSNGGILSVYFNAFSSKSECETNSVNNYKQSYSGDYRRCSFTGKVTLEGNRTPIKEKEFSEERDEETGYGYFGARYMDHELMTMWLSVDPLADKYPSISPYAYCAWNPVKLVDPDGCEIDTASVSEKIWNMVNPQHTDYNAAFAEVFNQLANDHTTLFSFEEWDEPRTKGNAQILGTFTLTESNDGCMDKTTIGFYWGGDYPQRYLYEEVYHAKQFLDGEFGFGRASISADWGLMGFDLYDEEDAHKWADNACNSPDSWTQEARNYYRIDRGLPETRRNVTEHYMQYDGIQRTTLPNYDENGVFKDVGYRTMRKPKQK